MSSDLKFIKSLEWCTKLPEANSSLESPVFLLLGNECFFKFNHKKELCNLWYNVYLNVKITHLDLEEVGVRFEVGFKNDQTLTLCKDTFILHEGLQLMWWKKTDDLRSKLPSDYGDGNWIKFRLSFEDADDKKMADKCVQTGSYLSTDVPMESLTEDMCKLLDTDHVDHDAEIQCGEHSIKVHKIILCTRSEVFKAMLQSNMLEGRTGVVEIQDMDTSHLQNFVRYMYTGIIPELTYEKAKVLYEAGDKYAIQSLVIRCSEYLQDTLSPENVLECLALADAHSDGKLKNAAISYSLATKIYLQKNLWLPFCQSYPKVALEAYQALHEDDTENKDV